MNIHEELMVHSGRFQVWVDECAKLFGGLDIAAVKAIRARDGSEYIVEVNTVYIVKPSRIRHR